MFLPDGSLLVHANDAKEFVLVNAQMRVAARFAEDTLGDDVTLLAYAPD